MRYTQSGKAVASFTIACNRQVKKGSDGKQMADFISCVAWEGIAQTVNNYLTKGREVLVEGRLQTRSYEAKDGSKRYVTEVIVSNLEFCGKREDAAPMVGQNTGSFPYSSGRSDTPPEIGDEDIPF